MKTKIPVWVNILQVVILAILTFQTYACYFNPQLLYPGITVDENSAKMIYVLGGRNAMMVIISVIALVRQNPRFYSFAFLMHSLRDFQDMFIAPLTGGGIVVFFVFLIVFVTPEILSYLKLNKMANEMEKA
ncbi:MAG: hypothetical protein J0L96_04120 [Anaerolineae bacterium]|nr:hypothetical protein [Anaerolineae bacterium]